MDYQEALDYILSFADFERSHRSTLVFDLGRIEKLLVGLGNPQKVAKSVNVVGTKGKGSTAAMIASILLHSGYRVGLYTSPHLRSFTERIQIDGRPIAEDVFARLTEAIRPEVDALSRAAGEPTTFEVLTALAFACFRETGMQYQVLEAGLGGRLDATNVVRPDVCVITSISYDHTDVLGDTLARIAAEKAGIIKPGGNVVCSPQFPEAMAVIEEVCRRQSARLIKVGSNVTWRRKAFSPEGQSFELRGLKGRYDLEIPLLGEYQIENAAAAVVAVEVLAQLGADISPSGIAAGLAQVHWPGRLQILRREPWVVADGAHNVYSVKKLVEALRQYFAFERAFIIFGCSSDKDIRGMVAELAALPGEVIVARSRHPRATAQPVLIDEFSRCGIKAQAAETVASALELALAGATPKDLICATGSMFVTAEAIEYMAGRK